MQAIPQRLGVLVTGASSGIGRATALRLDRAGHRVFAAVRTEEDAEAIRADASPALHTVLVDVTDPEQVRRARRRVEEVLGRQGLDGLVNNAGIAVGGPLELVPIDLLERQFEVNVLGLVRMTQAFLPLLRAARGRVVNVGSMSGRVAAPFFGPYCASKFAVEGLTDCLRMELSPSGVDVVLIEPGATLTPIWDKGNAFVEDLLARMGPELERLYPDIRVRAQRVLAAQRRAAIPPDRVARAIERALVAYRPRPRYAVGLDARTGIALRRLLPDRVFDRLVGLVMHR